MNYNKFYQFFGLHPIGFDWEGVKRDKYWDDLRPSKNSKAILRERENCPRYFIA